MEFAPTCGRPSTSGRGLILFYTNRLLLYLGHEAVTGAPTAVDAPDVDSSVFQDHHSCHRLRGVFRGSDGIIEVRWEDGRGLWNELCGLLVFLIWLACRSASSVGWPCSSGATPPPR